MATIKKAYQPIMSLLAANMSIIGQELYNEAEQLCSAKVGAGGSGVTTSHRDANGVVTAIRCSYFGQWFKTDEVEFGLKVGSASGHNPMCKAAVSAWTKQQADFKRAKEALLTEVAAGNVEPSDIDAHIEALEEARTATAEHSFTGYDSLEDLLEA